MSKTVGRFLQWLHVAVAFGDGRPAEKDKDDTASLLARIT